MRLRVIDRILIALSGLILLALAAWVALDVTGIVTPVSEVMSRWPQDNSQWRLAAYGICALVALLGIYGISVLFRRGKGKRGFIAQKSENGEIAISVKTIESLVTKCAQKHEEITVHSVAVEEMRNGLLIKLRASLPGGMNIPLAVGTLQKQIKQYVTACSGVDVGEVRVKVDGTDKAAEGSPYAVPDEASALPVEQPEPSAPPAEAAAPVVLPDVPPENPAEERESLTHQRLFAPEEELAMVPEPPVEEAPASPSEEESAAEAEEAAAEAVEPETEWIEQSEPLWNAEAEEAEAREASWEAIAEEAEALEAALEADETESETPDEEPEKPTEE